GDPARARFSLNESTLWSGGPDADAPHRTPRREAAAAMTRSRALFVSGAVAAAQDEIERLGASWSQAFLPVSDLSVHLVPAGAGEGGVVGTDDESGGAGTAAERVLDLARAEHRVE